MSSGGVYVAPGEAGSYRVVVRHAGGVVSDTATISVGVHRDPETNPSTALPFFSDGFEAGKLTNANGFKWTSATHTSVSDERSYKGRYSLRFEFPGGPIGTDSWSEQRFDMGRYVSELWIEYWLYVPANFICRDNPPNGAKLLNLWRDIYSDVAGGTWRISFGYGNGRCGKATLIDLGSSRWDFNSWASNGPWSEGIQRPDWLGGDGPIVLGAWNHVRFYTRAASGRQAEDGKARIYMNGKLLINYERARFYNYYGMPVDASLRNGYFMGWSNSGFDEMTVFYIDDVKFYTEDPGW